MTDERRERIKTLFFHAVELPPDERDAFLLRETGDDHALAREVKSLLDYDAEDDDAFGEKQIADVRDVLDAVADTGAENTGRDAHAARQETMPSAVGRYRIVGCLGEGGMGLVYEARQDQPDRTVALKIIRPEMASHALIRRFRHEAEVLGRLQHPGIAHIYDAGVAEVTGTDGPSRRPYFAMELVRGVPVTEYARHRELPVADRLKLVWQIAEALQHAHQHGVIHRDLKPANILVNEQGMPKILDFGVARLVRADGDNATQHTEAGRIVGTLAYMSPEQLGGDPRRLDTRSDVYALGVLLYQLTTGRLPHDVQGRSIVEAARTIADRPPERPSSVEPALRGDVEAIILCALEKDPRHRYQTADALGRDIQRFLNNEPINARPASALYHLAKFARRNRGLVAGIAAIAMALLLGAVISTVFAIKASRAEARVSALLSEALDARELAESERLEAQRQARIAEAVNEFLNEDVLAAVDPEVTDSRDITVRAALDAASERIDTSFDGEPLVEAAIRMTLSRTYRSLSLFDESIRHARRALALYAESAGPKAMTARHARSNLGRSLYRKGDFAEADEQFKALLDGLEPSSREARVLYYQTLNDVGIMRNAESRPEEAVKCLEEALEGRRELYGDEHTATLETLGNLTAVFASAGRYRESLEMAERVLAGQRKALGDMHPSTLVAAMNVAYLYEVLGRFDESESLYLDTLRRQKEVLGKEHFNTLNTMRNLALLYNSSGQDARGEPLQEEALELSRKILGEKHPLTMVSIGNLAHIKAGLDKNDEAEALYRLALEYQVEVFGEEHSGTMAVRNNLALFYLSVERFDDAQAMFEEVGKLQAKVLGPKHRHTLISYGNLAQTLIDRGLPGEAEPVILKTLDAARETMPEDDEFVTLMRVRHAHVQLDLRKTEGLETELLDCLDRERAMFGPDHHRTRRVNQLLHRLSRERAVEDADNPPTQTGRTGP